MLNRNIYIPHTLILCNMASKTKVREITLVEEKGTFATLLGKLYGEKEDYDFEALAMLRHLLSNEKARLLHIIKTKKPASLYALAKLLNRDFRAVLEDVRLLERFGIIDLIKDTKSKSKRHRLEPVLAIDTLILKFKL